MSRPVLILSDPTVASYGVISGLYRATFDRMGVACELTAYPVESRPRIPQGAVVLHHTLGYRFAPIPGAINIAVPYHEWSRYPAAWAERLNAFDEVWAGSDHLARVLRRSGTRRPVRFAPPALDLTAPQRKRCWSRPSGPFQFLFVGEPHFRKGHHLLLEGFRRVTTNRRVATLTIKTSPACPWRVPDGNVEVIAAHWSDARMRRLYARHDAFVSASLGEGLGLGVVEAMLARLPVATNAWGGHRSVLTPGGFVPVRHRVVAQPFCSNPEFYTPEQQCALSSPDAVAEAMERLMTMSPGARREQARIADQSVRRRYGFDAAAHRLREPLLRLTGATHK